MSKSFLKSWQKTVSDISREVIRSYLKGLNQAGTATYSNTLKSLKVFFRDFLNKPEAVETLISKTKLQAQKTTSKEARRKIL